MKILFTAFIFCATALTGMADWSGFPLASNHTDWISLSQGTNPVVQLVEAIEERYSVFGYRAPYVFSVVQTWNPVYDRTVTNIGYVASGFDSGLWHDDVNGTYLATNLASTNIWYLQDPVGAETWMSETNGRTTIWQNENWEYKMFFNTNGGFASTNWEFGSGYLSGGAIGTTTVNSNIAELTMSITTTNAFAPVEYANTGGGTNIWYPYVRRDLMFAIDTQIKGLCGGIVYKDRFIDTDYMTYGTNGMSEVVTNESVVTTNYWTSTNEFADCNVWFATPDSDYPATTNYPMEFPMLSFAGILASNDIGFVSGLTSNAWGLITGADTNEFTRTPPTTNWVLAELQFITNGLWNFNNKINDDTGNWLNSGVYGTNEYMASIHYIAAGTNAQVPITFEFIGFTQKSPSQGPTYHDTNIVVANEWTIMPTGLWTRISQIDDKSTNSANNGDMYVFGYTNEIPLHGDWAHLMYASDFDERYTVLKALQVVNTIYGSAFDARPIIFFQPDTNYAGTNYWYGIGDSSNSFEEAIAEGTNSASIWHWGPKYSWYPDAFREVEHSSWFENSGTGLQYSAGAISVILRPSVALYDTNYIDVVQRAQLYVKGLYPYANKLGAAQYEYVFTSKWDYIKEDIVDYATVTNFSLEGGTPLWLGVTGLVGRAEWLGAKSYDYNYPSQTNDPTAWTFPTNIPTQPPGNDSNTSAEGWRLDTRGQSGYVPWMRGCLFFDFEYGDGNTNAP